MNRRVNILIADRNRHVRELFDRELTSDVFHVLTAGNMDDVFKILAEPGTPDLMIIDPDLPDSEGRTLFTRLRNEMPDMPVVVHSFCTDDLQQYDEFNIAAFIKKEGNSIELVKTVISAVLSGKSKNVIYGRE